MQQFYRNTGYVVCIFMLVVLMHYLRNEALSGWHLLLLGSFFATGLVAGVLGNSLIAQPK